MILGGVGGSGWGNSMWACCSVALMVFGTCLYVVRNSSGERITLVLVFWIYISVVMSYVYNLSKYF